MPDIPLCHDLHDNIVMLHWHAGITMSAVAALVAMREPVTTASTAMATAKPTAPTSKSAGRPLFASKR